MAKTEHYWLFKTEPDDFSIQDLQKAKNRTTHWDGVRNYQARNFLRDDIQVRDRVLRELMDQPDEDSQDDDENN